MSALRWVIGLGRSGRGRLALAAALGALASGAALGLSAAAAWLIARASEHPPALHLMVTIVAVRAFGLARGVLRYAERLTGHDASLRLLGDLRVAAIERLERVLPARAAPLGSAELLARLVGDIDGLQDLWARVVLPYAASALVGAVAVALIAVLVPSAGVALAVSLLAAAIVAPLISVRAARGASARLAPIRAAYQAEVLDLLAGATELTVYGALAPRLARLDQLDRALMRAEARSAAAVGAGAALATGAAGAAVLAALWLGAGAVHAHQLAGVSFAVVVLLPLAAHELFAGLPPAAHQLPALAEAARRVREVFAWPPAVVEPDAPGPVPGGRLGVRMTGVRARWPDDGPEILRGLDLDLAAGSRIVVVGPSGSGKSTLAAILLRLLDPTGGRVELIGPDASVDLTRLSGDDVRGLIGWCAQDAYLFDSTLEANLRLARPDAATAELTDALRRVRLDAWVSSLPHGLATWIGEHGNQLSGGQRQRIALARVLLADRPLILFDEPTEHLDEPAAAALAAELLDATAGRTVIVMTHRPDLFAVVDRRLVLRDGILVEAR